MNYNRQDTLRMQQQMLRNQMVTTHWYADKAPDKALVPTLLGEVGVPRPLLGAVTTSLTEPWQVAIEEWANAYKAGDYSTPNLYIEGGRARGKSYATAAVLRKMALRRKVIGWRSWWTLVQRGYDRIRMADLKGEEYEEALFAEAEERWMIHDVIQVLAIDEIDLHNTPEFMLPELHHLMKHRTDNGLLTVMNGRIHRGGGALTQAKDFVRYRDETSVVLT